MCLPMSGLGLAGQVLHRKPLALLSPAAAAFGLGKTKNKNKTGKPPMYGSGPQPGGSMSYGSSPSYGG